MSKFYYDHEIVELLLKEDNILSKKDKEKIKKSEESGLKKLHDEFGKLIRNEFSFWNTSNPNLFEYKTEKMIKQPSELSLEIITSVWKKLNEENE